MLEPKKTTTPANIAWSDHYDRHTRPSHKGSSYGQDYQLSKTWWSQRRHNTCKLLNMVRSIPDAIKTCFIKYAESIGYYMVIRLCRHKSLYYQPTRNLNQWFPIFTEASGPQMPYYGRGWGEMLSHGHTYTASDTEVLLTAFSRRGFD